MKKFKVAIVELLKREVDVCADNGEEAENIVKSEYINEKHVLTADDFVAVEFAVIE